MSIILEPLNRLSAMLAACKPIQRWLGIEIADTDAAAQAAQRIHLDGISSGINKDKLTAEEQRQLRPYILVFNSSDAGQSFRKIGEGRCYATEGEILVVFSREYDAAQTISDTYREAATAFGPIIANADVNEPGLLDMSGGSSYLNIHELAIYFQGRTPHEEIINYGDAYDVMIVMRYQ